MSIMTWEFESPPLHEIVAQESHDGRGIAWRKSSISFFYFFDTNHHDDSGRNLTTFGY